MRIVNAIPALPNCVLIVGRAWKLVYATFGQHNNNNNNDDDNSNEPVRLLFKQAILRVNLHEFERTQASQLSFYLQLFSLNHSGWFNWLANRVGLSCHCFWQETELNLQSTSSCNQQREGAAKRRH